MSNMNGAMKQILIGTCVPGTHADAWVVPLIDAGFETVSINFHMSLEGVDMAKQGPSLKAVVQDKGAAISTLGVYLNPIQYDEHRRLFEQVIDSAPLYGASVVSTFAGAYEGRPVDEAFAKFGEVFRELAKRAEDRGVKIAIENCPMGGTWRRATCNIGFNPRAWERMFDEVPSDALGLEWEPAHQMAQLIDPIPQLRKWVGKVVHMHGKDAIIDRRAVDEYGIFAGTFEYSRTPGFGQTDWREVMFILNMGGYTGDICVEGYHDPVYNAAWEFTGQLHALRYLKWCRGGDVVGNPW